MPKQYEPVDTLGYMENQEEMLKYDSLQSPLGENMISEAQNRGLKTVSWKGPVCIKTYHCMAPDGRETHQAEDEVLGSCMPCALDKMHEITSAPHVKHVSS